MNDDPFDDYLKRRWHALRIEGWQAYLVLIPVALVVIMLGAFFFAIFAALFVMGGVALALRLWWLRRKLGKSGSGTALDGDYMVIERHTEVISKRRED